MFYLVIPTINGEINGYVSLYSSVRKLINNVNFECVIYVIDIINQSVFETDYYDLKKLIKVVDCKCMK